MRPELYDPVHTLVLEIVNASAVGDTRAQWAAYQEIKALCEGGEVAGNYHPFQWETLADFTNDISLALLFYEKALGYAVALGLNEYVASICLAMAESNVKLGNVAIARSLALQANEAAVSTDDLALRKEISELLLQLSGST